jgi:hypothetical protein
MLARQVDQFGKQGFLCGDFSLKDVVGYEPAGNALISTTTRATLMLSIIHGTATARYCSVML